MSAIRILSTKKLSTSERSVLYDSKFSLVEKDFIRIKFMEFDIDINFDILLFTSKNAVRSVLKNKKCSSLKQIQCICVGEKTKELLENNGFNVADFTHYAEDLTSIIAQKYSNKFIAFFCGDLRRDVLPDFLKANQIKFSEIRVYKNEFTPEKIEGDFDAVLFFSPSGVHSFLKKNTITHQICFCIGTTTSQALEAYTPNIILAKKPTITSVLQKVTEYFFE